MRTLTTLIFLTFLSPLQTIAQTEITIDPVQSMIMTGKGPGQDATINPFIGEDCFAIVKNIGERALFIRIQKEGKVVKEIQVPKKKQRKIELLKDQELYIDPNPKGVTRASIKYDKIKMVKD